MLEVCFNESVKGALAVAQRCENSVGGTVGIIADKKLSFFAARRALKEYRKRQDELQKSAVPLGGKREDIAGICLMLSEGDIRSPLCRGDCPRKEYIRASVSFDGRNGREAAEAAFETFWANCMNDLQKLQSSSRVRVWLDSTPDAQCGLLFLADLLRGGETEIRVAELPREVTRGGRVVKYRGWGDVEAQLFGTFSDSERVLTEKEKAEAAERWRRLREENAPLRAVENGCVISVDIDYYDDCIRREISDGPCKTARIIANVLNGQKILAGGVFIAKRIRRFIENGELAVVSENADEGFYGTVVAVVGGA